MEKDGAKEKLDLGNEETAGHPNTDKTHDPSAAPYATEEHLNEEQAERHRADQKRPPVARREER